MHCQHSNGNDLAPTQRTLPGPAQLNRCSSRDHRMQMHSSGSEGTHLSRSPSSRLVPAFYTLESKGFNARTQQKAQQLELLVAVCQQSALSSPHPAR